MEENKEVINAPGVDQVADGARKTVSFVKRVTATSIGKVLFGICATLVVVFVILALVGIFSMPVFDKVKLAILGVLLVLGVLAFTL